MSADSDLISEGPPKGKGIWRVLAIAHVIATYIVMLFTNWLVSNTIRPAMEVPPNRYFAPSSISILTYNFIMAFGEFRLVIGLLLLGSIILTAFGKLDSNIRLLVAAFVVAFAFALGGLVYGAAYPWAIKSIYGNPAFEALYSR